MGLWVGEILSFCCRILARAQKYAGKLDLRGNSVATSVRQLDREYLKGEALGVSCHLLWGL